MIRIGVFGANPRSKRHIEGLKQIPGFKLTGIYDPDPERTRQVSFDYNLPSLASPDSLIHLCDAIDFELSAELHFDTLARILTNSKHVFINYPLCFSLDKLTHLSKLANEANVILQVGNHQRFQPAIHTAVSFLNKPMFIEIVRSVKSFDRPNNKALLKEVLIRDIDLVLYLNKSNIKRINVVGVPLRNEPTDLTNARLEFDNGCVANITINMYSGIDTLVCKIFQAGEWFLIDLHQNNITRYKLIKETVSPHGSENNYTDDPMARSEVLIPEKDDPHRELTLFRDSIVHLQTPLVGIDNALFASKITMEILEKTGKAYIPE